MDAHRFDALIRRLADRLDRRQSVRVLATSGAIGLLASTPALAKNKGKKKKIALCLAGQPLTVPKKKKRGYLAQGASLGACGGANVSCATGTKPCNGACIPATACCVSTECGENAACLDGTCVCAVGFRSCRGTCLAEDRCCIDAECNAGFTCQAGTCTPPPPYCAGRDACYNISEFCDNNGSDTCRCFVTPAGTPICAALYNFQVTSCDQCSPFTEICVRADGPNCNAPAGCVQLCPYPR